MHSRHLIALGFGSILGLFAAGLTLVAFFFLGVFTCVSGDCAPAPDWWPPVFSIAWLITVPLVGSVVGVLAGREFLRSGSFWSALVFVVSSFLSLVALPFRNLDTLSKER